MRNFRSLICAALAVLAFLFCACAGKGGEVVNGDASAEWFRAEFIEANQVGGNLAQGEGAAELPAERAFLLTSQEEYDAVFAPGAGITVDFETEDLILFTFEAVYRREITVKDRKTVDGTSELTLEMRDPNRKLFGMTVGDACTPYQRFVIIRTEKSGADAVRVTLKK